MVYFKTEEAAHKAFRSAEGGAMDDAIAKLQHLAFQKAAAAENLDDFAKATAIAKDLAEVEKNASELVNAGGHQRLEIIKSIGTFLVPVVSLLAMFATLFIQNKQLVESRQQIVTQQTLAQQQTEDTQWRELLSSLKTPALFESDPTLAPRLQSFFKSPRYGDQAKQISMRLMGKLTNAGGFIDLYNIAFPEANAQNVSQIISILKSLTSTRTSIGSECNRLSIGLNPADNVPQSSSLTYWGYCYLPVSETDFIKANTNNPISSELIQARQAFNGLNEELIFVSKHLSAYLRKNYGLSATASERTHLDLSNIYFELGDLSGVDFTNIDIRNTEFDWTTFDNAKLTPTGYQGEWFYASNWWDAGGIDPNLLDLLVADQYPFSDSGMNFWPLSTPTEEHYRAQISELCVPARAACDSAKVKFSVDVANVHTNTTQ